MEDKTFDLLQKMYGEFSKRFAQMDQRFEKIDQRFDKIDQRFEKLENEQKKQGIMLERLDDRVSEAFEAIQTLSETNEQQHQEIMKELKGDIQVVETVIKRIAK